MAVIDTLSTDYFITNFANVTASSITDPPNTLTEPTGDGVIDMGNGGACTSNGIRIVPFGIGTATNTFLMSVYAWTSAAGGSNVATKKREWVAILLASFTCTLSTKTGATGGVIGQGNMMCDTITLNVGNANISNEIVSPTGNVTAHILLDAKGAKKIEIRFGTNGSASSCNCLVAKE